MARRSSASRSRSRTSSLTRREEGCSRRRRTFPFGVPSGAGSSRGARCPRAGAPDRRWGRAAPSTPHPTSRSRSVWPSSPGTRAHDERSAPRRDRALRRSATAERRSRPALGPRVAGEGTGLVPVLLVPLLVVVLGNPERAGRSDLGGDAVHHLLLLGVA